MSSLGAVADVDGTTPFVIGSTTKSFTALAVMQLVDSGDVSLADPVRDHVPELNLAPGEPVEAITVRDLLRQTSGLDDLSGGPVVRSAADGTALDAVAELAGAELVSEPGQSWRYAKRRAGTAGVSRALAAGLSRRLRPRRPRPRRPGRARTGPLGA